MAELRHTASELARGIRLRAGEAHQVKVFGSRRVRMTGMFFDLDKAFLLPTAIPGLRLIRKEYEAHPGGEILIVGHTDTSGRDAYNLALSLERAEAMAAYLADDAVAWDRFFSHAEPRKRWGLREIQLMLSKVPTRDPFFKGKASGRQDAGTDKAIRAFQESEGLEVDGVAGPDTRRRLIESYMAQDGTSLPPGAKVSTHGCGEHFPETGAGDGIREERNRRVEIFLFDGAITPPPPGKTSPRGSTAHPAWVAGAARTIDFTAETLDAAVGPFELGIPSGEEAPWTAASVLRVVSEDGSDDHSFPVGSGRPVDNYRFFELPGIRPGLKYTGFIENGGTVMELFGPAELRKFQDQEDAGALPLPVVADPEPDRPAEPAGPLVQVDADPGEFDPSAVEDAAGATALA